MPRRKPTTPPIIPLRVLQERHKREEHDLVAAALEASHYSLTKTAAALGIPISTLQRLLDRHPDVEEARRARRRPGEPR